MQGGLHGQETGAENTGRLGQRMAQNVDQHHARALGGRQAQQGRQARGRGYSRRESFPSVPASLTLSVRVVRAG